LQSDGKRNVLTKKRGLVIDPYFTARILPRWLSIQIPMPATEPNVGELAFGTIEQLACCGI